MEEMDMTYSTTMLQEQLGICPGELSDPPGTSYGLAPSPVELSDFVVDAVETERDFPNNHNNHVVAAHEDVACISSCNDILNEHEHPDSSYSGMVYTPTPSVASRVTGDTDSGSEADDSELNYDLQKGSGILKEIMKQAHKSITWPFRNAVDENAPGCQDYYKIVEKPIWLRKMREKFDARQYETITEFVADFRLMLENCYRFNGPDHSISKKAQKLETILEQKLALLSRDLRDKTSIAATTGNPSTERIISGTRRRKVIVPHDSTALLNQLRIEEKEREREQKRNQMEEKKRVQEDFMASLQEWEDQLLGDPCGTHMKAMWELPQIGHFFFLCREPLNIGEVPQYEIERCLLMPRESLMLSRIMTTLLSTPYQRTKLDKKPFMPYKVWEEKLRLKLRYWFRMFKESGKNTLKLAMKLGIEENFFHFVGHKNPLEKLKFHELSFYRRVWIVKSLCDYCMEQHEALREACEVQDVSEQREYPLGTDAKGNLYLHFPQFCGPDLRIYRQSPLPVPKLEKKESIEGKDEYLQLVRSSREKKPKRSAPRGRRKQKARAPPPRDSRLRQKPKQLVAVSSDGDDCSESSVSSADESVKKANISPRKSSRRRTPQKASLSPASSRDSTPSNVVRRSLRKIIEESKQLTPQIIEPPASRSCSPSSDGTATPVLNLGGERLKSVNHVDRDAETDVEEEEEEVVEEEQQPDVPLTSYSCDREDKPAGNCVNGDAPCEEEIVVGAAGDAIAEKDAEPDGVKMDENDVEDKEGSDVKEDENGVKEEGQNGKEDVKEESSNVKEEENGLKEDFESMEKGENNLVEDVKGEVEDVKMEANGVKAETDCDVKPGDEMQVKEEDSSVKSEARKEDATTFKEEVNEASDEKADSSGDEWEEKFPKTGSFELVADSVEQLRALMLMFAEPEAAAVGTKRSRSAAKGDTRKKCEKELYESLERLLKELEPWEQKLIAINRKAKIKMRKEQEMYVEEVVEKEVRDVWASEESASEESGEGSDVESTVSNEVEVPKTPKKKPLKPVEASPVLPANLTEEMGFSARGRLRKRRIIPNNAEDQSLKRKKVVKEEAAPVTSVEGEAASLVTTAQDSPPTTSQSWMPSRFTLEELKEGQQAGLYSIGMVNGQPVLIKAPVTKSKPTTPSKAGAANSDKKFPMYRFTAPGSQGNTANFQTALKTLLSHAKPVRPSVPPSTASTSSCVSPLSSIAPPPSTSSMVEAVAQVPDPKPDVSVLSPTKSLAVSSSVTATKVFSVSGGIGVNNISQLPPAIVQQLVKQQEVKSSVATSDHKIQLLPFPLKPKYAANVTVKELLQKALDKPGPSQPAELSPVPGSHTLQQQQKQIQDQLIRKELQRRITQLEEKHEIALQQLTSKSSAEAQAVISEHQAVIQKLKAELQSRVTILVPQEPTPKVAAINKKQSIDQALKAVMTTVSTTLPTAQIKVVGPSPFQMPCQRPYRPVTMTTTAMKGSIPVVPSLTNKGENLGASLITSNSQPTIAAQPTLKPNNVSIQPALVQKRTIQPGVQRSVAIQPTVQQSVAVQPAQQPSTAIQLARQQSATIQPTQQQSAAIQPTQQQSAAIQPAQQQSTTIQPTQQQSAAIQPAQQQSTTIQPTQQQSATIQPAPQQGAAIQPAPQPSPSRTLELKITPRTFMTNDGPVQGVVLPPGVILPPKVLLQLTTSKDKGGQGLVVMQQGKDGSISRIAVDTAPKPSPVVMNDAPKPQVTPVPQAPKIISAPSTSSLKTTQEKLMLYQVNGQLVTSQGIPVSISQGQVMMASSSVAAARPSAPQVRLVSKSNVGLSPGMTVVPKTTMLPQTAAVQLQSAAPVQMQNLAVLQASGQSFIQVQQPQLLQLKPQVQPQLVQVRSDLPPHAKIQLQAVRGAHPQLQQLKPQPQTVRLRAPQPQLQTVQVKSSAEQLLPQAQLQILQQQGQQLKILQPQATPSRQ
ncbi:hypothetical protein CAPTEDRAFT_222182 [Capitella teleta]|uniref:Bromo domain-containing protein n=1 Tax=Capitella teleta TaxID=283909 RepID=R7UHC5_CAPTE|nr:hypothetical protein CAPTEDRAFT_222182 [Capitella teleta]|eukprot:ELU05585.1 hypothetical protein CAPTEDRAFT_222182 [Capitella teleta]